MEGEKSYWLTDYCCLRFQDQKVMVVEEGEQILEKHSVDDYGSCYCCVRCLHPESFVASAVIVDHLFWMLEMKEEGEETVQRNLH